MSFDLLFSGAGGDSGDDTSSTDGANFVQKPDTLRSNDTFEGLLGLCIGPIKGPVTGMKSVRVNDTAIEDASGNLNFHDFTAIFADGDPLKFPQLVNLRLGAAGAPASINLQLRNVGGSAAVWLTRTVDNTNADAIDLRFLVQQLYKQTEEGIFENTASIEVQMKPVGTTTWINPFQANTPLTTTPPGDTGHTVSSGTDDDGFTAGDVKIMISTELYNAQHSLMPVHLSAATVASTTPTLTITGKTSTPYVKELRIKVPNKGVYANKGWDVRVRLNETEDLSADPNFEKRTISWESMAAVYFTKLGSHTDWRGVSWLQLYGKASDAFNGVPEVTGIYDTKIVQVPPSTVYDPVNRTYTGAVWNGSWAKAYTNDPAWCINDAISDGLSGIARLVPGAHLNKWDALELSKYCSQKVSNGAGGQHARFSLNLAIGDAQRSDEFIRYMAGACGATAWDNGEGEWRCIVDKSQNPVALFTYENIEGEFQYSHTDVDTRFNDITVIFLNEEFDYREDRIRIEDPVHIAKYGRKPTKVVGIGCTNRQQAVRWAILKMRTCTGEYRTVSFTTNRQGKYLERFNWILVADQTLNMTVDDLKRTTGRIVENKGGSIVLRDTIRLEVGVGYSLRVTVPNPNYNPDATSAPNANPDWALPTTVITRTVTNSGAQRGDVREIFINTPLPTNCAENANVALEAPNLPSVPKVYRVIDLKYGDDGERVIVSAIEVDTGKYVASDTANYNYAQPGYPGSGGGGGGGVVVAKPIAPAGGVFTLSSFSSPFGGVTQRLTANWDRPPTMPDFAGFKVRWKFNHGQWWNLPKQQLDFWELENEPQAGRYDIEISCVNSSGREGPALTATISVGAQSGATYVSFGPSFIDAHYDGTGVTPQDLPKDFLYKLSSNGVELDNTTWQYRVIDGGVNHFNTASGWKPMVSVGGIGVLTLSSIEVDNSKLEIQGSSDRRRNASITVVVDKVLGATDPASGDPTGGGGGTGGTATGYAIQSSGFLAVNTPGSAFIPITNQLTVNLPSSKSATSVTVALTCNMGTFASNDGPWNIEYKLQRLVGTTWTDVGTVKNSDPDPYLSTTSGVRGGTKYLATSIKGTMNAVIPDSGLVAGSTVKYRVVARIATLNPAGGTTLSFTGKVEITSP